MPQRRLALHLIWMLCSRKGNRPIRSMQSQPSSDKAQRLWLETALMMRQHSQPPTSGSLWAHVVQARLLRPRMSSSFSIGWTVFLRLFPSHDEPVTSLSKACSGRGPLIILDAYDD